MLFQNPHLKRYRTDKVPSGSIAAGSDLNLCQSEISQELINLAQFQITATA